MRSARQVQPAPGYLDSSTLLFDSEDEGTGSESDHYSEDQGSNEAGDKDRHVTKKLRLQGKSKAQAEASSPKPDSSCLAYYPETYAASRKWNKLLGLPPPNPMGDGPTVNVPERDVNAPGRSPSTKPEPSPFPVLPSFPVATKSEFYHTKPSGFEALPGEIRSRCLPPLRTAFAYCHAQRVGGYRTQTSYQTLSCNHKAGVHSATR